MASGANLTPPDKDQQHIVRPEIHMLVFTRWCKISSSGISTEDPNPKPRTLNPES